MRDAGVHPRSVPRPVPALENAEPSPVTAVAALVRVYTHPPPTALHVSASWFNPFEVPSTSALTSGILAGVFIYWGWDTAFAVNEETADSTRIPGRAAVTT